MSVKRRPVSARRAHRMRGFTLLELTIALVLLALLSSVMFGALSFAGRSWDGGEAKAAQVSEMRQTEQFLRAQIGAQYPLRAATVLEAPLYFSGSADEIRYAAALGKTRGSCLGASVPRTSRTPWRGGELRIG